jgi:hypothetical protein
MIQFENHLRHSSSDKVFEAVCGANEDNEGLSPVHPFRALVLCMFFFKLSTSSHGTIM